MYKLILLSPDGDYVTEKTQKTFDDCCEQSFNMGSRWFFYPFHFIIKDNGNVSLNQRIIEPPDQMDFLKRKSLKNAIKYIKDYGVEYLLNDL